MSELSLIFTPSQRNYISAIVARLNGSLLGSVNLQSTEEQLKKKVIINYGNPLSENWEKSPPDISHSESSWEFEVKYF